MTRDERLLLLLARGRLTETDRDAAHALIGGAIDWERVLSIARRQEIVPLVHRNLEGLGFPGVPTDVRETLAVGRRVVAARNGLLVRELMRVLSVLDTGGVPAIPMKGVALSEALYGDRGIRDCSDVDVLVPSGHARDALRLLRGHGYAPEFTEPFFESLLLRGHIEYTLMRRECGFSYVVDLHWGIGWSAADDRRAAEALWADSRRTMREDIAVWAMSPEWELLTLAVHAARHGWQPVKWLVDVHDYCARRTLDWMTIIEKAQRFGWLPALEQTFGACRMLLGTPAPPAITARTPMHWRPALDGEPGDTVPDALRTVRVMSRPAARARYLLGQLFRPTLAERRFVRLPSALQLFYYPLRPVRLGGKWGWRALQRLRVLRPMESG